jgi:hypothetical protein
VRLHNHHMHLLFAKKEAMPEFVSYRVEWGVHLAIVKILKLVHSTKAWDFLKLHVTANVCNIITDWIDHMK